MEQRFFSKSRMIRGMGNLALCIASFVVTIVGVELALRSTAYGRQFQRELPHEFFPRFYYRPDSINGYDITPNFPPTEIRHHDYFVAYGSYYTASSNELGCRDERMDLRLGDVPGARHGEGAQDHERVGVEELHLRPLLPVTGVLDRQRMQAELALQRLQIHDGRVDHVEPTPGAVSGERRGGGRLDRVGRQGSLPVDAAVDHAAERSARALGSLRTCRCPSTCCGSGARWTRTSAR